MSGLLNYILWLPIVGAIAILFIPKDLKNAIRYTALGTTALTFVFCIMLYCKFDQSTPDMQF